MKLFPLEDLPNLRKLNLAVVGHVEWVTFLSVEKFPQPGVISHGEIYREEPAGGAAVAAVKIAKLTRSSVHLFTALGNDLEGRKSFKRLENLGIEMSVAWRDKPTRKAISMIDIRGERAITVAGDRLQPIAEDQLPWEKLNNYDGIFVTATDSKALHYCRKAKIMITTPRIGLSKFDGSNIKLDALIGSDLDPDEKQVRKRILQPAPKLRIATQGAMGGEAWPGGRFEAFKLNSKVVDAYGCGDSFAAGVTAGLSSGWETQEAISLGAHCGAECATHLGPY